MKLKLFIGIILLTITSIVLVGCAGNSSTNTPATNQTSANNNSSNQNTIAASTDIKRTELTEDAKYAAELKIEPSLAQAGQDVNLIFMVKDKQGAVNKNLKIVHEKLMHLLVVSDDLAQFDHVHPEQQPDGSFRLKYKFPNGGTFKLYSDFTPQDTEQIVNVFDVKVGGQAREKTPLVADKEFTKTIDGLTFTMKADQPLKAASGTALNFYVTDADGKAVTDLQPYLGAMAHFVVISEDTTKFLHVHAMEGETTKTKGTEGNQKMDHGEMEMDVKPSDNNAAKPTVMAHTEFPTGGMYKIWGQFQRGGKVFTVPFVLNVAPADVKTANNAEVPKDAIKVSVSGDGFSPSSINVKKGETAKIAFFRKDANNCGGEVVFPKLNVKKTLPAGQTTVVEIKPQESGEIAFACGMGMMKGKVLVQ